jgi:hypothetical protein
MIPAYRELAWSPAAAAAIVKTCKGPGDKRTGHTQDRVETSFFED